MLGKIEVDGIQLSTLEKEALDKLKSRSKIFVDDKFKEDTYMYYRHLVAFDFNVDEAEKNLKECFQWRKKHNVDSILTDYKQPEVIKNYFCNTRLGFDKEGNVVLFFPMGRLDSRGIYMSTKLIDLQKAFVITIEDDEQTLQKNRKNLKGPYPGFISIYDLKDLSFANAMDKRGLEYIIKSLKLLKLCYPERVLTFYVINISPLMTFAVSFVMQCFPAKYRGRVKIYGTDGWKDDLLKIIDADVLPAFLGGNKTDPDGNPNCPQTVCQAGKIDKKYFIHRNKNSLAKKNGVKKFVLPRASYKEIEFEIKEPGTYIEWEWETKNSDIGFGLFFKEMDGEEEKITELVPFLRLNTEEFAEIGVYNCDNPGTYIMLFDNSYSWVRSKEIYCRTKIMTPMDQKIKANQENLLLDE